MNNNENKERDQYSLCGESCNEKGFQHGVASRKNKMNVLCLRISLRQLCMPPLTSLARILDDFTHLFELSILHIHGRKVYNAVVCTTFLANLLGFLR